jgi:integrase
LSDQKQETKEVEKQEEEMNPYSIFLFAMNSPVTRQKYIGRFTKFLNFISLTDGTIEERCRIFVSKTRNDSTWAVNSIVKFLWAQKQRVQDKEITGATVNNYVKAIKLFCEVTEIYIQRKNLLRGLPKGRRYADDRAPTLEEIRKVIEYPDRRIKAIVCTMVSSGIRLGAWDYLKWGHISDRKTRKNNRR